MGALDEKVCVITGAAGSIGLASAEHGAWYMIVLGAVAVVTMLACPQGLWGWVAQRFDLHFFPVQRRVHP